MACTCRQPARVAGIFCGPRLRSGLKVARRRLAVFPSPLMACCERPRANCLGLHRHLLGEFRGFCCRQEGKSAQWRPPTRSARAMSCPSGSDAAALRLAKRNVACVKRSLPLGGNFDEDDGSQIAMRWYREIFRLLPMTQDAPRAVQAIHPSRSPRALQRGFDLSSGRKRLVHPGYHTFRTDLQRLESSLRQR